MTGICAMLAAGTLQFRCPMERIDSMEPSKSQSTYDARAVALVYETPLEIDSSSRPYRLVPGLCELPKVSADGLVYTFRMVEDAALTSRDVKRAIDTLRDPEKPSPGRWTVKMVEDVAAPDDATLRIRLSGRQHVFPWMMTMPCCAATAPDGSGTGPYRLESWWRNHEMVFVRNPSWRGWARTAAADAAAGLRPYDEIRYRVVDDATTAWLMFLKGELDWMGTIQRDNRDAAIGPDGKAAPALAAAGKALYGGDPGIEIRYIGMNMDDPVLGRNRKLRQALCCAFDFPSWSAFWNGAILRADGPVPPGVEGCSPRPSPYRYDPEKAKRLLAEAGYPDGIDAATGRRLTLTLSIGRPSQESREAGELVAGFFAACGIRLELDFLTWESFLGAVTRGDAQMFMMAWVGDYPDAENFLQLFHSSRTSPGPNHARYRNPEYDAEYDAAMASPDAASRNAHWRRCQDILQEDCPWIFTHVSRNYSMIAADAENYFPGDFPYGFEKHLRTRRRAGEDGGKR